MNQKDGIAQVYKKYTLGILPQLNSKKCNDQSNLRGYQKKTSLLQPSIQTRFGRAVTSDPT
jgi:hypothetical protein